MSPKQSLNDAKLPLSAIAKPQNFTDNWLRTKQPKNDDVTNY